MKQRCSGRKEGKDYNNYHYRSITVCKEWENNFLSFYRWAVTNGYENNLTIDRIDVNGNYEPSNCRWVSQKTQQRNRRNNRILCYNGEKHCLSYWSEQIGVSTATLSARLKKGFSVKEAIEHEKYKIRNKGGSNVRTRSYRSR